MKLIRPKLSRSEKIVREYQSLRAQMVNLQRDHLALLEDAQRAKPNTAFARETRKKVEKRRKEIDAVWKQIQKMAPKMARAVVPAAKKTYERTKADAQSGYRELGEGMAGVHSKDAMLQKLGRGQVERAKGKITPHVNAILARQEAERRAIDSRTANWGRPPSRLRKVVGAIRRSFTGRRRAA